MYFDDVDSRRLCEDNLRVLRESAQTESGPGAIRWAMIRLKFRIVWLRARRIALQNP
jgi:hypothetical protein